MDNELEINVYYGSKDDCNSVMVKRGDTILIHEISSDSSVIAKIEGWVKGFAAACALLKADKEDDKYGIGNTLSMWGADDVADDMLERVGEAWGKFNNA